MARNKYNVDETLESEFNVHHLVRSLKYIKRYKKLLIGAFFFSLTSSFCGLLIPVFTQNAIDVFIPNDDVKSLLIAGAAILATIIIQAFCNRSRSRCSAIAGQSIVKDIRTDLFVDAYAEQQAQMLAYPGEHLAEHLETLLYRCPVCGSIDTLHSEDDCFFCECGLNLRYTEYGYLEPYHAGAMDAPFATLQAWYEWEKASLTPLAEESLAQPDKPLLCDAHQNMRRCDEDTHYILQQWQNGTLTLYADRLVFAAADGEALVFPFEQIRNISCQERQMLSFSSGGAVYEVLCEQPRSALKYQHLFHALRRFQKAAAD